MAMAFARRTKCRSNDERVEGSSQHNLLRSCTTAAAAVVVLRSPSSSWLVSGFASTSNNRCVGTYANANAITRHRHLPSAHIISPSSTLLHIFAPPGSGYVRSTDIVDNEEEGDDDDSSSSQMLLTSRDISQISPRAFPKTYEPMLEYPGTMRPGRTPENMPYHDLPFLNVDDPNPVPWPHFQEIEWHHKWEPPHEQALAMEEFIEDQGRWASVEDEAEMRMGMRRGVRERREMEEAGVGGAARGVGGGGVSGSSLGGEQMVIMDDDDEEDDGGGMGAGSGGIVSNLGLGDGVKAFLKNAAETASMGDAGSQDELDEDIDDDDILGEDEGEDDFLLDLGLGGDVGDVDIDDGDEDILSEEEEETYPTQSALKMEATADEEDDEDDDIDLEE